MVRKMTRKNIRTSVSRMIDRMDVERLMTNVSTHWSPYEYRDENAKFVA